MCVPCLYNCLHVEKFPRREWQEFYAGLQSLQTDFGAEMGEPEECKYDLMRKYHSQMSSASCQLCYCQGRNK